MTDGETIAYRAAVPVTVVVDGVAQTVLTSAATVGEVLARQRVVYDRHDQVSPAVPASIGAGYSIRVHHVTSWIERIHKAVPAPVERRLSFKLAIGRVKVTQKGAPGVREVSYLVTRQANRSQTSRAIIARRVTRKPHPRVIAAGVGEYSAIAKLAKKSFAGTIRLARAAISMVATAYTANCDGCSGVTAMGQPAGHGIVAVDPQVIPLGSHLYIPGYGRAVAGDTGGAIHGNRVDLGFNSDTDAMQFGRRSVTVYVLHP
ncbi:MAG TPA: 3D domain-containing protein [Candidatus Lustribacter sp.]